MGSAIAPFLEVGQWDNSLHIGHHQRATRLVESDSHGSNRFMRSFRRGLVWDREYAKHVSNPLPNSDSRSVSARKVVVLLWT